MAGKPPRDARPGVSRPSTPASSARSRPPTTCRSSSVVGASLFDDRFGLADRKPKELVTMPFLANDRLDPKLAPTATSRSSLEAGHNDTVQFALRQLMRRTRSETDTAVDDRRVRPRHRRRPDVGGRDSAKPLGLQGRNGQPATSTTARLMDRHVWVQPDDGEPEWAVGGSYQAVRIIRMFVEFWDRTRLAEQETLIGRKQGQRRPAGHDRASSPIPDYAEDPDGKRIPLDAHIRLANPRTTETEQNLILRRGFNYSRGFDGAGRLDQGLAFIAYQRSLQKGVPHRAETAEGRAARGVHHAGGRRLFLCAAGDYRFGPVPRRPARRLTLRERERHCEFRAIFRSGRTFAECRWSSAHSTHGGAIHRQ